MNSQETELSHKYQQKTDKQHCLDNPDTYIGSIEQIDGDVWLLNESGDKIIEKNINYIPALFKLFDEGIVNCRDHVIRMQTSINNNIEKSLPVSYINITIQDDGVIVMENDGNGIDVVMHPEYNVWIPELIFGHLRTSTNYDKTEKKIVGGKNGFGFKLVLIWSSYGQIETVDHIRGLKYIQEFNNNLDNIGKPIITKYKGKPYTKVSFKPDYKRLGLDGLSEDMKSLLKKRIIDISAVTDKSIKVKCNNNIVPIKNFLQYIDLYIGDKSTTTRVYEEGNERWEYAVSITPSNEFIQVSFVNGIHTSKGGKHVEYILNQITRKLVEYIEKKKKIKVNGNSIKEQIILFIRCDIENPTFDSQTKDYMNTPMLKFGSKCEVSDKFIEKIAKLGIMEVACAINNAKEDKAAKKTDGIKSKNIRGIPKLTDANWAGTDKSKECMVIFCEGDSAKTGIISGLSSEDRNNIGVYPLKGKVMNIRGEVIKKITENKEIAEIKKILGLESGKKYNTLDDINKNLRYSKVLFMTDQDLDGSHIKGLCINLFQCEWPELIKIEGFINFMNTPILKAFKGTKEFVFYNDGEYEEWKTTNSININEWKVKYYKGLGTSTKNEFTEYFKNKKVIAFTHTNESENSIDMVFNKKRSDDRKEWLKLYNRKSYVNTSNLNITYEDFINKEFIHFSKYDCDRSIPNLMDGLKISLRKIIYSAFKKNLTTAIKVAQFSGYVSEHSCYHHGEASLNQAIVGLAQTYVGSNNINLLVPSGQFGSRIRGGKDSASERYIFTMLHKITRLIFPSQDDYILTYLNDDGTQVEPIFYVPIIPMVLVNGTTGIGTGFSTEIMCYNPQDIMSYLKNKLIGGNNITNFTPYYEGFAGDIIKISDTKYLFKGKYEKINNNTIRVIELPIGYWTEDFKQHLENLQEPNDKNGASPIIKDYDDKSKDTNIDFTIIFNKGKLEDLENEKTEYDCNGLEKLLKLYTTNSTTNMNLFNADDKLVKYNNIEDIINDYYDIRLKYYLLRKNNMIHQLENELILLTNREKYVREVLSGNIDLRNKKKNEINDMLKNKSFAIIDNDVDYKYLIKMPMDCVSDENMLKIVNDVKDKTGELNKIRETTIQNMWLLELETLTKSYEEYKKERISDCSGITPSKKNILIKKPKNVNIKLVE